MPTLYADALLCTNASSSLVEILGLDSIPNLDRTHKVAGHGLLVPCLVVPLQMNHDSFTFIIVYRTLTIRLIQ